MSVVVFSWIHWHKEPRPPFWVLKPGGSQSSVLKQESGAALTLGSAWLKIIKKKQLLNESASRAPPPRRGSVFGRIEETVSLMWFGGLSAPMLVFLVRLFQCLTYCLADHPSYRACQDGVRKRCWGCPYCSQDGVTVSAEDIPEYSAQLPSGYHGQTGNQMLVTLFFF